MSKSDKELTIELTQTFITAWMNKSGTTPIQIENVNSFMRSVYATISGLYPTGNGHKND